MNPLNRIGLITLTAYPHIGIIWVNLQLSPTRRAFYVRHFPILHRFLHSVYAFLYAVHASQHSSTPFLLFPINPFVKRFHLIHPSDGIVLFPFIDKMVIRNDPWVVLSYGFHNL